ncbi:MAG: LLM class flavin-dependent oxidoreductase [Betaproteobacteria bacterium]|nr:LLM class flavin-dependent oxidoreductase [Betaproteobacteria bacterium]
MPSFDDSLKIYSTCPPSQLFQPGAYLRQVQEIARWSEDAGCEGILIYTDNKLLDPWLVSQVVIEATEHLCPLVAVQPIYMHPYSVAKMVASMGFMYGRSVHLNMVAGGFTHDLVALNDPTPHDERYARLVEYATIIQKLLRSAEPVSFTGSYYQVANLKLTPSLPADLAPSVLVSGSSKAGMDSAQKLGATAVQYPKPSTEYATDVSGNSTSIGIRIGIVARSSDAQAWSVARTRFPEDRKGQLTHQLAIKASDSSWHRQLSELGETGATPENPYWLVPFENYKTFCPYLVGSYDRVADEVARYIGAGYRTFILDVPASPEEMRHIGTVFERVTQCQPA